MDSAASNPSGALETGPVIVGKDFLVLGPVEVYREGVAVPVGGPKQRSVLAMLIAHAGRKISLDRVIEAVYGEAAPGGARHSVQTYISTLRHDLGDVIRKEPGGYLLEVDLTAIDAVRFETLVHSALSTVDKDPETAAKVLRDALGMWRGHAYADVDGRGSLEPEIIRLSALRLSALEARIDADLALGRHRSLLGELDSLTIEHPLSERFRGQQMLALYRCGRQTEALRAYEQTRAYLADEIGIDPSPDLRDLEQRILDHDPGLELPAAPSLTRRAVMVLEMAGAETLMQLEPSERASLAENLATVFETTVRLHHGEGFVQRGSAMYAAFQAVGDAVRTANDMAVPDEQVGVRIAVDHGDVEIDDSGEVSGPPVRRSAAIVAAAHSGQILLSGGAHTALLDEGQPGWLVRSLGVHPIQGVEGPQQIFQLVLEGQEKDFPPLLLDNTPLPLPIDRGAVAGFELRRPLSSDLSGITYRAYQRSVGREVVVTVIDPLWANDPGFISRFEVEAQLVTRLQHPHIVPVLDYWRDPTGAYLVAPLVGATSLDRALDETDLTPERRIRIIDQLGAAMSHAHGLGVVHGAISPATVIVDESENAYLTGIGFVLRLAGAPRVISRYTAPELARGEPVTTAADVFSLGRLTAELLADDIGPEAGEAMDAFIARAIADQPADRFSNVNEFLIDLAATRGDSGSAAPLSFIRNPYKGLEAFGEADAGDFFGRSQAVDDLCEMLARQHLVAVVGPSGCGKSSLVEAGLVPAVRAGAMGPAQRWLVTSMFPGSYPFAELESALARVAVEDPGGMMDEIEHDERGLVRALKRILPRDTRLLLIIDQFEELFTLTRDDATRERFLEALVALAEDERSNVRVVVTLRADFFDRPLQSPSFGELLKAGTFPLTTPSPDRLSEAIQRPAESVGAKWEPGLVEQIVDDVADAPGTLPLLQYALTEVFAARRSDELTHHDYRAAGGVLGALGTRADEVYRGLGSGGRSITRQLFLALVTVQKSGEQTRRRARLVDLDAIGERSEVAAVLKAFGDARLLTFDRDPVTRGPTADVAHEALLTRWPRLADWISEAREDLLLHQRLTDAADEWDQRHRDEAYLLTGGRLAQFQSWSAESNLTLAGMESEFLDLSSAREKADRGRRRRIRKLVMSGFGIAALLASVLGVLALISRQEARANADLAHTHELAASAISVLDDDPEVSLLLALEAADTSDSTVASLSAVHESLAAHRKILTYRWPSEQLLAQDLSSVLSPDGKLLVASSGGTYIEVVHAESGDRLWGHDFGGQGIARAVFNHDGSQVVATYGWFSPEGFGVSDDATESQLGIHQLDATTGETVRHHLIGPRCGVVSRSQGLTAAGDDAGSFLAIEVGNDSNCNYRGDRRESENAADRAVPRPSLVNLGTGEVTELNDIRTGSVEPPSAAISADGRYLLVADEYGPTIVVDRNTGEEMTVSGWPLGMSPTGLALTWAEAGLQTWDVSSGQALQLITNDHPAKAPWLSPDGTVVAEQTDSWVSLWDTRTGNEVDRLLTGLGAEGQMSFSIDGSRIAIPDAFGATAVVFDLEAPDEVASVNICDGATSFREGNGRMEVAGDVVSVRVMCPDQEWDTQYHVDPVTYEVEGLIPPTHGFRGAFSSDGQIFAAQEAVAPGFFGAVELYDSSTGEVMTTLDGICVSNGYSGNGCAEFPNTPFPDWPWDLDFSPDGSLLAMAIGENDAVIVWDVRTGEMTIPTVTHNTSGPDRSLNVEFSPDGSRLAASFVWAPQELWLLSTDDWSPITQYKSPEGAGEHRSPERESPLHS